MLIRKIVPAIVLGVILSIVVSFAAPPAVLAQDRCVDAAGYQIECPKEKRATVVYPSFTPTTPPSPTPPPTAIPSATPPVSPTPTKVPVVPGNPGGGGLGWLFGLIIAGLGGGLFLFRGRFFGLGSDQGRESPSKPPNPNKPGGGDEQGFIIEGGKPGMGGSEQGFDVFQPGGGGSEKGFDTEMKPGEQEPPEAGKPGEDSFQKWVPAVQQPGEDAFFRNIPSPDMQPGSDQGFDVFQPGEGGGSPGSDKMGAQPHMSPGENQGFDTDMKPGGGQGVDNPDFKTGDIGIDDPNI